MYIFWFLLIGLAAGWLAGQIMKGGGFGLIGDLVVGVIGALLGGILFDLFGLHAIGLLGNLACDRPPRKPGHGHGRRDRPDRVVACRQAGLRGSAAQLGGLLYTAPVDSATVHLVVVVEDGARTKETGERGL